MEVRSIRARRVTASRLTSGLLVAVLFGTACTGGGLDEARKKRKELQRFDAAAAESTLVERARALRAEKGLPSLEVNPNLADKARRWAATMAREGRLYHSQLAEGISVPWQKLAENVGQAGAAERIHSAWVSSPRHYANLTDPAFTHIGVGVAPTPDGMVYAAQVFMQQAPAAPVPAPPRVGSPPAAPSAPTAPAVVSPPRPAPRPPALRTREVPEPVVTAPPAAAPAPGQQPSARLLHVLEELRRRDGR